jgi:hypothetical protein
MEETLSLKVETMEISLLFEKQWVDTVSCVELPQTLEKKMNPSDGLIASHWVFNSQIIQKSINNYGVVFPSVCLLPVPVLKLNDFPFEDPVALFFFLVD